MIAAVVLFCLQGTDPASCTPQTAVRHWSTHFASVQTCMLDSQVVLAAAAPHPIFGPQYVKVVCGRA